MATIYNNFNPAMLEIGLPAAWQVLGLGLLFALAAFGLAAAFGRQALRVKAASVAAGQTG